ncbi:hypothetical protein JCM10213_006955 [Rhodosporidiobolus nylandii]
MQAAKRKAAPTASKGKGKSRSTAAPPSKRAKLAPPAPKQSNRPKYGASSDSGSALEASDGEESEDDEEQRRAEMLAALEAHQAALLGIEAPVASTSSALAPAKEQKSVWDMDMDDLEDEAEESEDESESEEEAEDEPIGRASAVQVVAFAEPGRESAGVGGSSAPMDKKDLRDFKAGKIKNLHKKASIADEHNVRYVGGKAKAKQREQAEKKKASLTPEQQAADAAEESHLDKLDSHLSALIKPLASGGSASLPGLLRELPIEKTKALKGHTPLPKNAPRLLRKGQNAANLKRAKLRDEAAGNAVGSKKGAMGMGREALTLKEKRKADGTDKRQRGLSGAVGKYGRGQISLSKREIMRVQGPGGK